MTTENTWMTGCRIYEVHSQENLLSRNFRRPSSLHRADESILPVHQKRDLQPQMQNSNL